MNKQWIKNSDFNYTFLVDEEEIGKIKIHFKTSGSKAICTIGKEQVEISRTGFWKTNIQITNKNGEVLLKTYPEKWYASNFIMEFQNKKYKLIIRNNPLAEFAVTKANKDILAYGLASENKKLRVRISSSGKPDILFDFLLWYLFIPIANENFGNSYPILMSMGL